MRRYACKSIKDYHLMSVGGNFHLERVTGTL